MVIRKFSDKASLLQSRLLWPSIFPDLPNGSRGKCFLFGMGRILVQISGVSKKVIKWLVDTFPEPSENLFSPLKSSNPVAYEMIIFKSRWQFPGLFLSTAALSLKEGGPPDKRRPAYKGVDPLNKLSPPVIATRENAVVFMNHSASIPINI